MKEIRPSEVTSYCPERTSQLDDLLRASMRVKRGWIRVCLEAMIGLIIIFGAFFIATHHSHDPYAKLPSHTTMQPAPASNPSPAH